MFFKFKTKSERQANYLLKMILFQNDKYEKKENQKVYLALLAFFCVAFYCLVSFVDKDNPTPFIFIVFYLISSLCIGSRGCVIEHSGDINNAVEIESLNILFELLPKHKDILLGVNEKRMNNLISNQEYYINNYHKYEDKNLYFLGKKFIFDLENLKEMDCVLKKEKEIERQESQLEDLEKLQLKMKNEIANKKEELKKIRVITKTKEMNDIEDTAPNMMLVD